MQKRKGISLIETLISLTIVGIALVALLPVMTVRKDGNDLSRGNRYWTETAEDSGIISSANSVSVGNPVAPTINNAVNFKVYNEGFKNKDITALRITNDTTNHLAFRWGGMTIDTTNNGVLDIHAGPMFVSDTGVGTSPKYPRRIYSNANKLIVENAPIANNYSFNSDTGTNSRGSAKYYSLVNNGAEYLSVDIVDAASVTEQNNIIGIGANAARYYTAGTPFIGIFHSSYTGTDNTTSQMEGLEGGLIIGYKDGDNKPDLGANAQFLIYKPYEGDFKINAPLTTHTYVAGQVLVASDKRLKNIMGNYEKSIKELIKIKPVEYNLKSDGSKKSYVGVVAQDLQKIFPEAVVLNKATGYLMVSQDPVFYAMLNSIKDLDAKNKQLKSDNDKLEAKVAKLRAIRDSLKTSQGGAND